MFNDNLSVSLKFQQQNIPYPHIQCTLHTFLKADLKSVALNASYRIIYVMGLTHIINSTVQQMPPSQTPQVEDKSVMSEQSNPGSSQPATATESSPKAKKKKIAIITLTIILLLLSAGALWWVYSTKILDNTTGSQPDQNDDEISEETTEDLNGDVIPPEEEEIPAFNSIAYIREGDTATNADNRVFLLDLDTNSSSEIDLDSVTSVFNQPTGRWFAYFDEDRLPKVYDKHTGDTFTVDIATMEGTKPQFAQGNTVMFSPDGEKFTYSLIYQDTKSCNQMCPEIDLYPDILSGYYSYDIIEETSTYLGKFLLPSNWDSTSQYLYLSNGEDYHEYELADGVFKVDVTNGKVVRVRDYTSEAFGTIYAYSDIQDKFAYMHINTVLGEYDSVDMRIEEAGNYETIDSSDWSVIQPHIHVSNDHAYFVHRRRSSYPNNSANFQLILVNFATNERSVLTTPGTNDTDQFINWSGNNLIYSRANEGTQDLTARTRDLYMINVETGIVTRLTKSGDIHVN